MSKKPKELVSFKKSPACLFTQEPVSGVSRVPDVHRRQRAHSDGDQLREILSRTGTF